MREPRMSLPTRLPKKAPKRQALPAHLSRLDEHHEPTTTACACGLQIKRISEDLAKKLDYQPGAFTVARHVRGKWACRHCVPLASGPCQVLAKLYHFAHCQRL